MAEVAQLQPSRATAAGSVRRWTGRAALGLAVLAAAWFLVTFLYFPNYSIIRAFAAPATGSAVDTVKQLAASSVVRDAVRNTLLIAVGSVITVSVVGIAQAFLLEAIDLPCRTFFTVAYAIPLVFGSVSAVTGYATVYGQNGLLTVLLRKLFPALPPTWFSGAAAILVVHTFTMTGYHFLFLRPAIRRVDFSLVEAARSLGMRPMRALLQVVVPALRPVLLAAMLMVFIAALGSFAAPNILGGGRFQMVGPLIQSLTGLGRPDMSAALGLALGVVTAGMLVWVLRTEKRSRLASGGRGARPFQRIRIRNPLARGAVYAVAIVLAIINLAPLVVTALMSLSTPRAIRNGTLSMPTLENFRQVLSSGDTLHPLLSSLELCAIAIPLALVVGVFMTHLLRRRHNAPTTALQTSLLLPYFLPGVLLGLGFLTAFGAATPLLGGRVLVGGFWILPLAYAIALLPTVVRFVRADYAAMDPALDDAARSLGAHSLRRFAAVTLPLLAPVLLQIAALGFNQTFDEYTVSVMLYNVNDTPFGVALGALAGAQNPNLIGVATAYVVISTLIALTVVLLADRIAARRSPTAWRSRETTR